ncbi:DMT family transporter [Candidatus Amesbacteria bacterium]|nr:DMT family transporter [Candidatus Amesbacteria bacterium]MBI2587659.1 DMT family transporter [Candidatus Amesbacteria bacterium]
MNSPRAKAYALLLITTAIWGVAGPVIKYTVGYLPPFIFLLYRFSIAAVIGLFLLFLHRNHWPKKTSDAIWITLYCFLTSTVSLGLLFLGYEKTTALDGSIINALYPIMVSTVGVAFLHEHVTDREKLGMGLATLGTLAVIFEPNASLTGNLYIVASLMVGVVLAVMAKLLLRHLKNFDFALTQLSFIVGFLTILPIAIYKYPLFVIRNSLFDIPLSAHLGVWYMALVSGTLAYALWHRAQKTIETGETAVFTYLYPVFTIPLSLFWLHEKVSLIFITGALTTAAGVIIAELKPRSRLPARH